MSRFGELSALIEKRNLHKDLQAGNSYWFVEYLLGNMVNVTAFQPDPNTATYDYYYNAEWNVLFRRIKKNGVYAWKKVSI